MPLFPELIEEVCGAAENNFDGNFIFHVYSMPENYLPDMLAYPQVYGLQGRSF